MTAINLRPVQQEDASWIKTFMHECWGGEPLVIRGDKKYYPSSLALDGLIAEATEGVVGFLFYEMTDQGCEIILLEKLSKFQGLGKALLKQP